MFRNDFQYRVTMLVLPAMMLVVLSLTLPTNAQQLGWVEGQPTMTYTSSDPRDVPALAPTLTPAINTPLTYTSPAMIGGPQSAGSLQTTSGLPPTYQAVQPNSGSRSCQPGLAQSKAVRAAQIGLRGHLGGSLGGAKYEGVGWSNQSPQDAIEHCCYWGTRPTAQIGVSKGRDGCWYACVLYY